MSRIGNKKINILDTNVEVLKKELQISSNKVSIKIPLFSCLEFSIEDKIMTIKRRLIPDILNTIKDIPY